MNEINKIRDIPNITPFVPPAPSAQMRPPYGQSVTIVEAILNDPTFWQYLGKNDRIQSIQMDDNQVTITTEEGKIIKVKVIYRKDENDDGVWPVIGRPELFDLEYEGRKMRDDASRPAEIDDIMDLLHNSERGYPILQIFRDGDHWKLITLYDR